MVGGDGGPRHAENFLKDQKTLLRQDWPQMSEAAWGAQKRSRSAPTVSFKNLEACDGFVVPIPAGSRQETLVFEIRKIAQEMQRSAGHRDSQALEFRRGSGEAEVAGQQAQVTLTPIARRK